MSAAPPAWVRLFLPQADNMRIHRAGLSESGHSHNVFKQPIATQRLAGVKKKIFEAARIPWKKIRAPCQRRETWANSSD